MEFKIGNNGLVNVVCAFENEDFLVSEKTKSYIKENELFTGKRQEVFTSLGPFSENLILLGLGKREEISLENIRRSFLALGKTLKKNNVKSCNIKVEKIDHICYKLTAMAMVEGILNANYVFDKFVSVSG